MINGKPVLAIIPARGGSKRLPAKNKLDLCGKPLLAYSIEAAYKSVCVDRVIVSTDDDEICEIAIRFGAEVPFMRPKNLATDEASSIDVVCHVLEQTGYSQADFDSYFILLQPTSPLRLSTDIDAACQLLSENQANSVVSVCPCEHSPLWTNTLSETKSLDGFISPEIFEKRSQDLPQYYRLNGAIYLYRVSEFLKKRSFFGVNPSFAYVMATERSVDVDELIDLEFCRFLVSKSQ